MQMTIRGSLPQIIRNDADLYEGNLAAYFKAVFDNAQNLSKFYHGFRHMFHVVWLCYCACAFYQRPGFNQLNRRQMRNLLIAAMFHDFNHPGMMGDDDLNIERAIRGLQKYILPEDAPFLAEIVLIIRATQYPYVVPSEELELSALIIRDADMAQALGQAWIQQVVIGLAAEWAKEPIEVLKMQPGFLKGLDFHTSWARQMFPQKDVDDKIAESNELIQLLE